MGPRLRGDDAVKVYIAFPVGYFVLPRFAFSIALSPLPAIALTILSTVLAIPRHAEIRA